MLCHACHHMACRQKLSVPTLVLPAVLISVWMFCCWPAVCREKADPKSTGSVGAPMGGQVIEVMTEPGGQLHWHCLGTVICQVEWCCHSIGLRAAKR